MAVGGMREVEKVMLHCTRIDTLPTKGPWSTSRWSIWSLLLLAKCTPVSKWLSSVAIVCITIRNPLLDYLTPCAIWLSDVSQKLNVLGCMLYNVLTYCLTKIHSMEFLCMNFFSLSVFGICLSITC
jgi:hypothetical protein